MKNIKSILFISAPLLCAMTVGVYFGYSKYFEELKNGSDDVDAFRWALIGGLVLSVIGLAIGLIIDLFAWLIITSNRKVNE